MDQWGAFSKDIHGDFPGNLVTASQRDRRVGTNCILQYHHSSISAYVTQKCPIKYGWNCVVRKTSNPTEEKPPAFLAAGQVPLYDICPSFPNPTKYIWFCLDKLEAEVF